MQKATTELPDPMCVLEVAGGAKFCVKTLTLGEKGMTATTLTGVVLDVPLQSIKKWDFSAGKLQYVGDLTPESTVVTPFVEIPKELAILARVFFAAR
ncbi:MAG: hypothetical protein QM811_15075 [Pirellulales bacterium]